MKKKLNDHSTIFMSHYRGIIRAQVTIKDINCICTYKFIFVRTISSFRSPLWGHYGWYLLSNTPKKATQKLRFDLAFKIRIRFKDRIWWRSVLLWVYSVSSQRQKHRRVYAGKRWGRMPYWHHRSCAKWAHTKLPHMAHIRQQQSSNISSKWQSLQTALWLISTLCFV